MIGNNYNQVVKELRCHFSEKKAMALLYKLDFRFFQITVAFVFGIFQQYVISFLIMFLNGSLCIIELPGFCHA